MFRIEPRSWWRLPRELRFLVVGGYNTVFGYLTFSALYLLLGRWVHYLLIGLASHAIAAVNAFLFYRHFVFRSVERWQPSFIRFNLSQLLALGFGLAGLYSLVQFGRIKPLLAQALVTAATVLITYTLHRFFSFRTDPADQ